MREKYEQHHKVTIEDNALVSAARLADRYITDRLLPDKAIDLIDEASSHVRLRLAIAPVELREAKRELAKVRKQLEDLLDSSEYEQASKLRNIENELSDKYNMLNEKWQEQKNAQSRVVGEDEVAQTVYSWTGIPVSRLVEGESSKLLQMEYALHKRVVGQHEAIVAISKAVRRARSGMKDPNRPTGSFIFLGPTGVSASFITEG